MNIHQPHPRGPDFESAVLARAVARWFAVLIGFAMLFSYLGTCSAAETSGKEHKLKAAFVYNFTKFIEWPTNCFRDANTPFVVAAVGRGPDTAELEKIAGEYKVNGRDFVVRVVTTCEAARDAHVLFIPASEDAHLQEWLPAFRGRGILTIGESELFAKQGGIINFLVEGERIRFEINMDAADAAGLKVSAQLQKLAKAVRRKS